MKNIALALAALALVACSTPATDQEATSASDLSDGLDGVPAMQVDATWGRFITGTPTIGFDATTPAIHVNVRVDDRVVRRDHPGFDGLERPYALVPRANGPATRLDLPFRGTSQVGFIQLHPVDDYESDTLWVTEADLAVIRAQGIVVALETNVGVAGGDNFVVTAKNP